MKKNQPASEDFYKSLAERSFAGVYLVKDGIFKFINRNAASYAGYTQEELIGKKASHIVHPVDRKKAKRFAEEMLKGDRIAPYSFRVITKKRKIRWIMEAVTRITHEGMPAVLGTSMDITEFMDARNKIEEFNELKSSILDSTPHATLSLEDRKIIFANDAVESVFGWKPEELMGKSTRCLFRSDKEYEKIGAKAYTALQTHRIFIEPEYPYKRKDGQTIICKINAARIGKSLHNKKIVVTYENITEQKKAQDILRQRTEELELKTRHLEETNIALEVLLRKREEDKAEIEQNVMNNILGLIAPGIQRIKKCRIDDGALKHLSLLESNLADVISPFLRKLSSKYLNLTPKEILVANLIKDEKSGKEIADLLNITIRGVEFHRYKIRSKLGIKNEKVNLRSHLLSLAEE